MKKTLMTFVLLTLALTSFASELDSVRCRSYNTGNLVVYSSKGNNLVFQDRMGNELESWSNVTSYQQNNEFVVSFKDEKLLVLNLLTSNGLFNEDDSLQCFIQNKNQ